MGARQDQRQPSAIQASGPARSGNDTGKTRRRSCSGNSQQRTQTGRPKVKKYLIVIEPTETGYSAYSPDVPGCVSTGASRASKRTCTRQSVSTSTASAKMASLSRSRILFQPTSNCRPKKKTPREPGVSIFPISLFQFPTASKGNPAKDLPETPATSANAKGAAACVALWLQSGVYVRASPQTTGRLLRACARCHRPAQSAS
jgi:hypothetical protein